MATDLEKLRAFAQIEQNIAQHGHHIYMVSGGEEPRFAYTIGLSKQLGFELILAGACFYMADEVVRILNDIAAKLKLQSGSQTSTFEMGELGSFSIRPANPSWTTALMLGALDFYKVSEIPAYQIIPDAAHWTIDVPDLSEPWSAITAPVWQWLKEPWSYPVPSRSVAGTNLDALRGERITEAMRWEEGEWELYAGAGPDVPKDAMRVVPLGTLVAADRSLEPVLNLRIGEGLWRDADSTWHPWAIKANS
jgi:hypothetical protein